jgi:LmbE family N-acetylglucosaminyl deacetylase
MKEIISPHLDDAVYSCWHALDKNTRVTTVFAGYPEDAMPSAWDISTGFANARSATQVRIQENAAALGFTGARIANLSLLDTVYRSQPDILDAHAVVEALSGEIDRQATLYCPSGFSLNYWHPDHGIVREAGKILSSQGVDVRFYADVPYCVSPDKLQRWPEQLPVQQIEDLLETDLKSVIIELSPQQALAKQVGVRKYISQFARNDTLAGGVLSDSEMYKWEAVFVPISNRRYI